jgi:lipopolysaccharide transport system permease protein
MPDYHKNCGSHGAGARNGFDTMRGMLDALWKYRGFILASVRREFDARYRVAVLGGIWAVLQPLAQVAVYTLVLSEVMRARLPGSDSRFAYGIYLCAGILTWSLFTEIVTRCTGVFVDNANLLKKLSFPRICLPSIAVLSSIVNFAIVFALFLVFLLVTGNLPGRALLALVPLLALQILLATGLGVLAGVANVFYRDVAQGVAIVVQFWFWLTPIVYPSRTLPGILADLLAWNPMWSVVRFAQTIFLEDRVPAWSTLAYPALVAGTLLVFAMFAFRKLSGEIVDEL